MPFTTDELAVLRHAAEIILRSQQPEVVEPAKVADFVITRAWISDNRTQGGSWKAAQLAALGVSWPPAKGWAKRAEGMSIPNTARLVFESFAAPPGTRKVCNCPVMPWEDCPHFVARMRAYMNSGPAPKASTSPT